MRRILVENARRKASAKHGGKLQRGELPESKLVAPALSEDLLALDEALSQLAQTDAIAADFPVTEAIAPRLDAFEAYLDNQFAAAATTK